MNYEVTNKNHRFVGSVEKVDDGPHCDSCSCSTSHWRMSVAHYKTVDDKETKIMSSSRGGFDTEGIAQAHMIDYIDYFVNRISTNTL